MQRTLLAVDGNSLAHRAFHAYAPRREGDIGMRDSKGNPTYAVYGFFSLLAKICFKVNATDLVVGFDDHTKSVRKAKWPHYKAQREAKSPELYNQMDQIQVILAQLGLLTVVPPGLEADDVMASAAHQARLSGYHTFIATSDRDSFALINDDVTVLRLLSGLDNAVFMTPQELYSRYNVDPHNYLQFAALRGDPSDNLPGVKGVGEKTAAKIFDVYPDVHNILADPDAASKIGKAVVRNITSGIEAFKHNMEVMEVDRSITIDLAKTALTEPGKDPRKVLTEHELPSLVKKFEHLLGGAKIPEQRSTSDQGSLFASM